MSKKEEKVWRYLVQHRNAEYAEIAEACDVDIAFVKQLMARIGSDNWREEVEVKPKTSFRWAVYNDGLHIWDNGSLVGVIPPTELPHLMADLANRLRYN